MCMPISSAIACARGGQQKNPDSLRQLGRPCGGKGIPAKAGMGMHSFSQQNHITKQLC